MTDLAIVDTHAHIIDPARFPFAEGPGYKPTAEETGTREMFAAVLDAHGVRHALLVQLSGYGYDNAGILDAVKRYPQKFKAIAVVDPESSDRALEDFSARGVVGVRFNLASYRGTRFAAPAPSGSSRGSRGSDGTPRSSEATRNGRRPCPSSAAAACACWSIISA